MSESTTNVRTVLSIQNERAKEYKRWDRSLNGTLCGDLRPQLYEKTSQDVAQQFRALSVSMLDIRDAISEQNGDEDLLDYINQLQTLEREHLKVSTKFHQTKFQMFLLEQKRNNPNEEDVLQVNVDLEKLSEALPQLLEERARVAEEIMEVYEEVRSML